jgi:hypothetical protein
MEHEVGGAYGTHLKEDKYMKDFGRTCRREESKWTV